MRWLAVSLAGHCALFAAWPGRRATVTAWPASDRAIDARAVDAMDLALVTLAPAVVLHADAPSAGASHRVPRSHAAVR